MQKRRNDVKARTTLLLALPDEHQLRFNKYKTAQELWAAILKTFCENEATKKTKKNQLKQQYGNFKAEGSETLEQTFNRLQVIVSQLEFMDIEIEQDDPNQKFLTSLAPEWLMHTIVWRNRSDLDIMSLDDLYNHLKVYEPEVQKKLESNSHNMAFISSAKNGSGNGEVNTASIPTASTQVSPAGLNVATASIRLDTACAYIASQSNGSQIKYEDINQTDEDDIEEIDINFMENEEENHALVADEEAPTEFALMAKSSYDNEVFENSLCSKAYKKNTDSLNSKITDLSDKLCDTKTMLYHYKLGLSQVEARLVEFKSQDIKLCEKIRGIELDLSNEKFKIERLTNELEQAKKEKGDLDSKRTGFQSTSKDLDNLLGSQRNDKNKKGLGYIVVPPPPAQVYSPPKKDMSWTGLPEFADDTITDYSRPLPAIENRPTETKTDKVETAKKPAVKYAKLYRKTSKSANGNSQNNIDDKGYWDSGCSRHMTGNISYLSDYEPFDGGYVSFSQGGYKITDKGTIKTGKLEFKNVYFGKDLKYNLFSVSQICDNKNSVLFTDSECIMLGQNFKLTDDTNVLLRTPRQHNMYLIDLNNVVPHKDLTCLVAKASADESMLWHRRLGHLNFTIINRLVRHNLVRGLPSKCLDNDHTCAACLKGKQHKASCKTKLVNSVTKPLHTLHMDLFCPTSVSSLNHKWYCLVVTDDFSRFTWTFFLKTKDETSGILRNFITEIENLKVLKVKIIRVLVNKSQNKTPYELFNGRSRAIGFLKPFGCHVMILNTLDNLGKFEAKGDEGYFIGYSMTSKAFRVFNKRTKRVKENLHVGFLENKVIEKGAGPNRLFDIDSLTNSMNYVPVVVAGTNSTNFSGTKEAASQDVKFEDILGVTTNTDDSNGLEADLGNMEYNISASPTPTFRIHKDHPKCQIISLVDTPIQTRTKSKEMEEQSFIATIHQKTDPALLQFCLFSWVRPIGTKWVLKNKKDERGIVIRNKARLVAQGHTQEEGIDYDEVFSPVARIEAIRLFLAYASFMGFTDLEFPARVYKMEKAMYGLHQAPRAWYGTLSKYLLTNGFQRGTIDQTLFIRRYRGDFIFVQVYVDDIIFGSSNPQMCREFEALMHEKFQMSAMGELNFFLGLQVLQKKDGIFLSQDKYVGDILKKFGYSDVRSANTPIDKENH
uniref:Uncharacterized protein n=1 Tax=Tanacetum cinerariifolium TaxID=118510 RepID=A0A699GXH9_TANCI|nr:hypothetical protein [Tanacetum cinerariifolium]